MARIWGNSSLKASCAPDLQGFMVWAGLRRRPQPDSTKGCPARVQRILSSFPSRYPPPSSAGWQADHTLPGGSRAVRGLVTLWVHMQFALWCLFQVEGKWGHPQDPTTESTLHLSATSSALTPLSAAVILSQARNP